MADALCYCLGEVRELSATTAMRRQTFTISGNGQGKPMNAADQVAVTGLLKGGAAFSIHYRGGVYFVPALAGLGSPHWRPDARGVVTGLTSGTRREHLARAALESIAYQTRDVIDAMNIELDVLHADGGATANRFLMQFQADVLHIPVEVAAERETTAIGAAALAGLAVGVFTSKEEVARALGTAKRYEPQLDEDEAERLVREWRRAVKNALE